MISLPNACSCSNLLVYPKNWQSKNAKVSVSWCIIYRFYDPRHQRPKQVMVKGMNVFKTLLERQDATRKALKDELEQLNKGYNPFAKTQVTFCGDEISCGSSILTALNYAFNKLSVAKTTKRDIKYLLTQIAKAIKLLSYEDYQISKVSKKVVKQILETACKTPDRFNKGRSYLMILFSELCELEIVDVNPVRDLKKKKIIKRIRTVLSDEERKIVNDYLKDDYPEFHRFLHIFFHSGARISEILRIKETDVKLSAQQFKVVVQKGREYREVLKPIKNVALPFWQSIMTECEKGDYVFSKGLKPGIHEIQPYQIGKRWYRLVKKKLGIQADFYSLKHLNLDEISAMLGINDAAAMASHTSSEVTKMHYAVNEEKRQQERLRNIDNSFS